MSWEKSYTCVAKDVSSEQIWETWADVNQWHQWDADIEYARMSMPFREGSSFELKPRGGPKVKIEILETHLGRSFTDLTRFPLARMYGIHEALPSSEGLELRHTVRIEGPLSFLWRKIVAEKIAAGMQAQAHLMIEAAKRRKTVSTS
ncbi:MAG: polyketide cyclase [Elusimicrobia bacterium]|nr:polyketide cyclase [Elusimicrobiota bacterium]